MADAEKVTNSIKNAEPVIKQPWPEKIKTDEIPSQSGISVTPAKKQSKIKDDKYCRVCGDIALGYNFNAVTCESCKAFFRRNAGRRKTTKCLFQGNCSIDLKTRRFCPHCRLVKCFSIGMKQEMILDELERKMRMAKVIQNRQKRHCKFKQQQDVTLSEQRSCSEWTEVINTETTTSSSLKSCAVSLQPVINIDSLPEERSFYRKLSGDEKACIQSVTELYESTLASTTDCSYPEDSDYSTVNQLVNNSEVAVRRLIKFVKRLGDFRLLSQDDQIASLKACVLNTILLRSVAFYSVEKDVWITPKGEIPTSILKEATGYVDLHDSHTRYCRLLKSIVQDNHSIMCLLQIITVFQPDGVNLKSRTLVSDIQDHYINLLKHYLEAEYSFTHAREMFPFLLQRVAELKGLSEEHSRVLLQVDPTEIEPLMLEVLNLK